MDVVSQFIDTTWYWNVEWIRSLDMEIVLYFVALSLVGCAMSETLHCGVFGF